MKEQIESGPCGCERFIIGTDVQNGDTICCEHTDECRDAINAPKPTPAPKAEKPKVVAPKVEEPTNAKAKAKK
jgi:hypothetical protein